MYYTHLCIDFGASQSTETHGLGVPNPNKPNKLNANNTKES